MTQVSREEEGNGNGEQNEVNSEARSNLFFENLEWLSTAEAAIYLRKFSPSGHPSVNAVHKLVSQGKIKRRKFSGKLFFKRKELAYLIECSQA
jgi:hypothetical protein